MAPQAMKHLRGRHPDAAPDQRALVGCPTCFVLGLRLGEAPENHDRIRGGRPANGYEEPLAVAGPGAVEDVREGKRIEASRRTALQELRCVAVDDRHRRPWDRSSAAEEDLRGIRVVTVCVAPEAT